MPPRGAGAMRERLTLQSSDPAAIRVSSLTRVTTTATATTATNHGFTTGEYVTVAGALPAGYCGRVAVTVTGLATFTYTVADTLTTPATGTITATFAVDAQGGPRVGYTTIATVPAELVPVRASERFAAAAVQIESITRFRIRVRTDVTAKWRALWTPSWPSGATAQTLEITGVVPDGDGRVYCFLECAKAPGV